MEPINNTTQKVKTDDGPIMDHAKGPSAATKRTRRILWVLSAIMLIAGIVIRIGARSKDGRNFANAFVSGLNPIWVNTIGRFFNLFPFSFAEWSVVGAIVFVLLFLLISLIRIIRKKPVKRWIAGCLTVILLLGSYVFFMYESGEDVYFYATPFSTRYGIGRGKYSTEDLQKVTDILVQRLKAESPKVTRNKGGYMINDADLTARVRKNMHNLGKAYPLLKGWYPNPKGMALSELMSKTNMTGIYTAWTKESNYNDLIPDYNIAFTMSHELAHLKSVLQENEANFVAYLACMNSDDADIRYSGLMLGYIYCGNELFKRDRTLWEKESSQLPEAVAKDLAKNTAYWNQYKGKAAKTTKKLNDAYLKQAGQKAGAESYNKVVDLIVAYELNK